MEGPDCFDPFSIPPNGGNTGFPPPPTGDVSFPPPPESFPNAPFNPPPPGSKPPPGLLPCNTTEGFPGFLPGQNTNGPPPHTIPQTLSYNLVTYGPKVSATLSIFGSSYIIWELIWKVRKKRTRNTIWSSTYNQILLLMSSIDIMTSIWFVLGHWMQPRDFDVLPDELLYPSPGNLMKCSAQGFFMQLGMTVPLYNISLALYACLTIRYGWREHKMKTSTTRKLMLFLPLSFGLLSAITGLIFKIFNTNPLLSNCWIASDPINCKDVEGVSCIRGENAEVFNYPFIFAPLVFAAIMMIGTMSLVTEKVFSLEQRSKKWTFSDNTFQNAQKSQNFQSQDFASREYHNQSGTFTSQNFSKQDFVMDPFGSSRNLNMRSGAFQKQQQQQHDNSSCDFKSSEFQSSEMVLDPFGSSRNFRTKSQTFSKQDFKSSEFRSKELQVASPSPFGSSKKFGSNLGSSAAATNNARVTERKKERAKRIVSRTQKVATQSIFFVGAFFMTWTCFVISYAGVVSSPYVMPESSDHFKFLLAGALLVPMQGFFNFLIFLRPRYVNFRERNPEWTVWKALGCTKQRFSCFRSNGFTWKTCRLGCKWFRCFPWKRSTHHDLSSSSSEKNNSYGCNSQIGPLRESGETEESLPPQIGTIQEEMETGSEIDTDERKSDDSGEVDDGPKVLRLSMTGDIESGEETMVETNREDTNPINPVDEQIIRRIRDTEEEKESIAETPVDYDAEDSRSAWVESGLSPVVQESSDNPDVLVQSVRFDPAMRQGEDNCRLEMVSLESSESLKSLNPIDTENIPPIEELNLSDDEWIDCLGDEEYEIMFYHGTDDDESDDEEDGYKDSRDGGREDSCSNGGEEEKT